MTALLKNTLGKDERIHGEKKIEKLFREGKSFISFPLRIVYIEREKADTDVSILVSVPKKKLKHAVKRNRIKRLIKEAYRLNKFLFTEITARNNTGLDIAFIYLKDELSVYQSIKDAVVKTAELLEKKITSEDSK